jgi:hypothetical protein
VVRSNGGSAFVYARDAASAVDARNALEAEAARSRAYRIVSADEMIRRGADSEAWFGLDARPGFAFEDSLRVPVLGAAAQRAAGGYLEARSDPGPGFVAYGRGLRRHLRVPEIDQLDVAPTIARLRGLDLPDARGRTLVGVLRLPADGGPAEAAGGVGRGGSR